MSRLRLRLLIWGTLLVWVSGVVSSGQAGESERARLARIRARLKASPMWVRPHRTVRVTLADCVRLATTQFKKVQATEYGLAVAKAQIDEANARFWPIFEYEYRTAPVPADASSAINALFSGNLTWFHSGRLGIGVPVTGFGKLTLARRLAEQGDKAAVQDQAKERLSAATKARQLYYGVQLGEAVGHLLSDVIDRLGGYVETPIAGPADDADAVEPPAWHEIAWIARLTTTDDDDEAVEEPAPKLSPIDRLKLQLFRAELEKRLAEARNKESLALEGLRIQLGLREGTRVRLAATRLQPERRRLGTVEAYIAQALRDRPDAKLVDIGVEAKRLLYALERRKPLPEVGIGGFVEIGRTVGTVTGVSSTDDFANPFDYTRAGVGLQLKGRFDPHGDAARNRKKQGEYYRVTLERLLAREGISLEVREAFGEAQLWSEQIVRSEENIDLSARMVFLSKSNLDLGVGERQEYLDALQANLLAQGQRLEAIFQFNSALAKLDEKIGVIPYVGTGE